MHRSHHIPTAGLELCPSKPLVWSATLSALRCLTPSGSTECCEPPIAVGSLSWIGTHPIPVQDSGLTSRAETPKFSRDSNNTNLPCYALVTHGPKCQAWKRLPERNLTGFLAQVERSSKSSWRGPHNNGNSENARKTLTPVTRKTPKTPACLTHR